MNSGQLNKELSTLERKVKLMLSEHHKLKEDLEMYRNENNELRSQMSTKEMELSSFQNKYKISKIVDNMTAGGDDSTELKEVLNNYIKEIDKCITHLSEAWKNPNGGTINKVKNRKSGFLGAGKGQYIREGADHGLIKLGWAKGYKAGGGAYWYSMLVDLRGSVVEVLPGGTPDYCIPIREILGVELKPATLRQSLDDCIGVAH